MLHQCHPRYDQGKVLERRAPPRGSQAVRMNAPRVGGSFAVWGGLFSTFDCTMVYIRQKEDPWNSIIAGATTEGFLQMRQGFGALMILFNIIPAPSNRASNMTRKMLNKIMSAPNLDFL